MTAKDYARAESFLPHKIASKILNASVEPHWLQGGEAFWYRRQTLAGYEFVLVESASGRQRPAFDHEALARALSTASGKEYSPSKLPFSSFEFLGGAGGIRFAADGKDFTCSFAPPTCRGGPAAESREDLLVSPDGKLAVFLRYDNLWLLDTRSGAERQITKDAAPHYRYATMGDLNYNEIRRRESSEPAAPFGTYWSPDSRQIFTVRVDERNVMDYPLVESVPRDGSPRPKIHNLRVALTGDPQKPKRDYFLIDVASLAATPVKVPEEEFSPGEVTYSHDGRFIYASGVTDDNVALLTEIDALSGRARNLLTETNHSFITLNNTIYSRQNVRVLPGSREFIWFSERDGWGHLYLYDLATGRLKRQITKGEWLVRDIIAVDEAHRTILFTAGGMRRGENPYYRHLYRVGLDGGAPKLLTPEEGDHEFAQSPPPPLPAAQAGTLRISPNGRYFIDVYSRVDEPPVSVLRRADGSPVATLEKADVSALVQQGWRPPEAFKVKSADGTTDLYGLLYLPSNFDPARRYRVIEHIYGGPQTTVVPTTYAAAALNRRYLKPLAELGFAVVILDARGTPQRSKAFQDHDYPFFDTYNLDDHIAAIRQLASRHPFMDLEGGIGVLGHSFGGFGAARAILLHPEFYTVAVASAGSHTSHLLDYNQLQPKPIYRDGGNINRSGRDEPLNWQSWDNSRLAANLQGKLLLAYGDLDENVYPANTLRLADALVKADKNFDLLYFSGWGHNYASTNPYYLRRVWDFFVKNMLGQEPPAFKIGPYTPLLR